MKIKTIQLGHGGGGLLSQELIDSQIVSRFAKDGPLSELPDGASLFLSKKEIVFSTDSFVVSPVFFPGGNIGSLSVHGTLNDIAVSGAVPKWLSLSLILEEGFEIDKLKIILDSVANAAKENNVSVVTGDTKVVPKGQCDGLYINTAGIGEKIDAFSLSRSRLEAGDKVLVSGTLGDHGLTVMAVREGMDVGELKSDSASVCNLVNSIIPQASQVVFMRDPTRGGIAATLNEIVNGTDLGITLDESRLPFADESQSMAATLGLDLLHIASEGRLICICKENVAKLILDTWKKTKEGQNACIIGEVAKNKGRVILNTKIGGQRVVDVPSGELLPRIC